MSTGDPPLLTAIIVAYNSADIIADTVKHLEEVTADLEVEILVVDNASSDDSSERAAAALRRGRVIRSEENVGFGRGVNMGLRAAQGRVALMMNDDVRPEPGCIQQMLDLVSRDSVGLVGPQMIGADGAPSFSVRRHLPGLRDELQRTLDRIRGRNTRTSYPTGDTPTDVQMLICACVMGVTERLREVGGFNEAFFMYGEDIDICRRLSANGYELWTIPTAVAVHERETAPERRIRGHEFSERILQARDTYYRIWLPRWQRVLVNLWRALGPSDQPFRFGYHMRRALWDGPSLKHLRTPTRLPSDAF